MVRFIFRSPLKSRWSKSKSQVLGDCGAHTQNTTQLYSYLVIRGRMDFLTCHYLQVLAERGPSDPWDFSLILYNIQYKAKLL